MDRAELARLHIVHDDEAVVTFYSDGTLAINPRFTRTDAAQRFWFAVQAMMTAHPVCPSCHQAQQQQR